MAQTYGDWLKSTRKSRGLTQRQLGESAGIGVTHLSKIENGGIGMPTKATRDRIHEALDTTDDDLVVAGLLRRTTATDGSFIYVEPDSPMQFSSDWSFGDTLRQWREKGVSIEEAARRTGLDVEYLVRLEGGIEPIPFFRIREQLLGAYDSLDDEFRGAGFIRDSIPDDELSLIKILPLIADRYSQITEERVDHDHIMIHHERAMDFLEGDATWVTALPASIRDLLAEIDWDNPRNIVRAKTMLETVRDGQQPKPASDLEHLVNMDVSGIGPEGAMRIVPVKEEEDE